MKYKDLTEASLNERRLRALLTPSWLSGLLAILGGLIVTGGVIIVFNFNNGPLRQQLITLENTNNSQPALTLPGQAPPETRNSLQNTWPLFAFWGMVGLAVYFVVESIIKTITEAEEFSRELNYVHAKRAKMIWSLVEGLAFRFVSIIVWLIFLDLFIKRFIPYSITAAQASVGSSSIA